jgi:hypothetical protein
MPRLGWVLAGLLATLPATRLFAQLADGEPPAVEQPRPASETQLAPGPEIGLESDPLPGEAFASDDLAGSNQTGVDAIVEAPAVDPLQGFLGYRYAASSIDWIVGNGDQFGMVSLAWDHYQHSGINSGLGLGAKFHFLAGPERSDMPPRVFDFSIGYQHRNRLGPFGYDVAASVMASSDFEGSAREGIRFPSHAVGFLEVGPATDLVFGIDYLDRGDLKLLPVAGLILRPNPNTRLEVVFPRPRAVFRLTEEHLLFVAGELGGGTWAIEREAVFDDLATYRDLRLSLGVEWLQEGGRRSAFEIGYLFDRRLEYTSGIGDLSLDDTVMLRIVDTF